MLRTLSQRSVRQIVTLAKCDRVVIGRIDFGLRVNTFRFVCPFSTEVTNKTEEKKGILETDKGFTPEGAAFTNPNIAIIPLSVIPVYILSLIEDSKKI